jgi:diaminopimelate decarboxylase
VIDRFPRSAEAPDGRLALAGVDAEELAARFGTPLYVYDAATLRERARAYQEPLAAAGGRAAFALKANPTPGVLRVLQAEGVGADAASAGEVAAALRSGFRGADLVVHGNAKNGDDIAAALAAGAGLLVIDAPEEAVAVAARARSLGVEQDVLLRVTPDIRVETHSKIETGHAGSKFGMEPPAVARLAQELPQGLRLRGLHVHLGSQVLDARPLVSTAAWCARFAAEARLELDVLNLGGGLGVGYAPGDPDPDPRRYAEEVVAGARRAFDRLPRLLLEPGRSIAAPAGVTLYRILTVKRTAAGSSWVAVDGGMGDNLRVSLYGARYAPVVAGRVGAEPTGRFGLAGRHCESGDVLGEDVPLADPRPGDLLAVPVTGAYHQSMALPYNLIPRPAAVMVDDGEARLITRRETVDDLLAREVEPA